MSPARRDYKPGRKQSAPRTRGQRGRGAVTKPLATAPKAISTSSDSDYTDCSLETIGSSVSSIPAAALAQLKDLAAKMNAAKPRPYVEVAPDYFGTDETDYYWMDQYWSDKPEIHRRAATIGEIRPRRGPLEVDDGAIFDIDL